MISLIKYKIQCETDPEISHTFLPSDFTPRGLEELAQPLEIYRFDMATSKIIHGTDKYYTLHGKHFVKVHLLQNSYLVANVYLPCADGRLITPTDEEKELAEFYTLNPRDLFELGDTKPFTDTIHKFEYNLPHKKSVVIQKTNIIDD